VKEVELNDRDEVLLQTSINGLLQALLAKKLLPENINNPVVKYDINAVYIIGVKLLLQLQGVSDRPRCQWELAIDPPPVKLKIGRHYLAGEDYEVVTESLEHQIRIHEEKNEEARAKPYRELLTKLLAHN